MAWPVRSIVAMILWAAACLLTLFLVFSGWWIVAPFLFAVGSGGVIRVHVLAIVGLSISAHLIGRHPAG
jgi:hypothetical protein